MNYKFKKVITVVTILLCLLAIMGFVWSFFLKSVLMGLSCGMLAVMLGVFVYTDFKKQ